MLYWPLARPMLYIFDVTKDSVPSFDAFMNPVLHALKKLDGSGSNEEIYAKVAEIMLLSDAQLELLHNPDKGTTTEVEYRIAWAKTYLKNYGLLENSSRGVWSLTAKALEVESVNPKTIKKAYTQEATNKTQSLNLEIGTDTELTWRDEVISELLLVSPQAFERLAQRLLRESGFTQVDVTGRTGDGGIDGKGIMRLGGLLSFHVLFQCKRYKGSVGSNEIRDFRGAMVGRADKGLFITTGNFTKDAVREASRDGAPAIDLIDGDLLINKLQELKLGIQTRIIEQTIVDKDWFKAL